MVLEKILSSGLKNYYKIKIHASWFSSKIKILLQNQQSCIVNRGTTTNYFKFEKSTTQGNPISAYLFILVLEIVFLFTKESKKINGLNIFDKTFLYTTYADDTTFFFKDAKSVIELMNIFDTFSKFSGLKPNKKQMWGRRHRCPERVQVVLCGLRCIDLVSNKVKILGVYYLYNDKLEIQENFKRHIIKTEKNLLIWRMRDLSIAGEITVFKTLAISKMVHLALVKTIPNSIMQELRKISKEFVWKTRNPKIKHDTLCKNYENGSLKSHDIMYKVVSFRCSCIRLYDNNSHYWKVIPLHMITQKLVKSFYFILI